MEDIKKALNELKCNKEVQQIILTALHEVRMHHDKPVSKEIEATLQKKLNTIINNET